MKIKILEDFTDTTVGKVYAAEVDKDAITFFDDVGYKRRWIYPNDLAYIEVEGEVANEPEQLTLRDQFAMSVIPPAGCTTSKEQAVYRYRTADEMMEARKK